MDVTAYLWAGSRYCRCIVHVIGNNWMSAIGYRFGHHLLKHLVTSGWRVAANKGRVRLDLEFLLSIGAETP